VSSLFGEVFVQQWHLGGLKSGLAVPVLEVGVDAPRVDDLIRGGQRQVKEAWDRNGRDTVCQGHCVAAVVHFLERVACDVEVLLGSNDVHLFAVVESLADEGHILQAEKGDVPLHEFSGATECELSLPVKGALSEDRSEKAVIGQIWLDFVQDLQFGLGGGADDNDVGPWNDFSRVARALVDPTSHLASMLPVGLCGVGYDLIVENLRPPRQDVDLPGRIQVSDNSDRGAGEVSTSSKC